jgi:hypothetical protein
MYHVNPIASTLDANDVASPNPMRDGDYAACRAAIGSTRCRM